VRPVFVSVAADATSAQPLGWAGGTACVKAAGQSKMRTARLGVRVPIPDHSLKRTIMPRVFCSDTSPPVGEDDAKG